jgi:hypothetical protein
MPQMTVWRMRITCWIPQAAHTLRMCNARCCSTAAVLARTRFSVTLYVHCLSCFLSQASLYHFNFLYSNKTDTTIRACNCLFLFVCLCVCVVFCITYRGRCVVLSVVYGNVNRCRPYIVRVCSFGVLNLNEEFVCHSTSGKREHCRKIVRLLCVERLWVGIGQSV